MYVVVTEQYIDGEYKKYNNNWDWSDDQRNTPQAFSHFTWEVLTHEQVHLKPKIRFEMFLCAVLILLMFAYKAGKCFGVPLAQSTSRSRAF